MAASTFFIPSVNVNGADSLNDAMNMMADYGFTRTLIVTDNMLTKLGMAGDVQKALEERNIFSVIYDGTQPNPTTENVAAGLKLLKEKVWRVMCKKHWKNAIFLALFMMAPNLIPPRKTSLQV